MTRLIARWAGALLLALSSCTGPEEAAMPVVARVASVQATRPMTAATEWCDVHFSEANAPLLALPAATPTSPSSGIVTPPEGAWVWVNLWATWCGPCLREIPLIQRWIEVLSGEGVGVSLWFLSLDEDAGTLAQFLGGHPDIGKRNSLRMRDPAALGAWIAPYGLKSDTGIPINILTAPGGRVRCVRTGAINDSDFPVVRNVLKTLGGKATGG